jgi:predicted RNA-binding protein with PIN domain
MRFLLDGYNLLFALGKLTARSGRSAGDTARQWLIDVVREGHGPASEDVTIVFDGHAPRDAKSHPVEVVYSRKVPADDVIEQRVRMESAPGRLTVVSDDGEVRESARRRGCVVLRCLEYCDRHLIGRPTAAPPQDEAEKPTGGDSRHWIEVFRDADGGAGSGAAGPPY